MICRRTLRLTFPAPQSMLHWIFFGVLRPRVAVCIEDVDAEALTSRFKSPETEHADRELQTLVREAVSRLGKTAGEMFVLRYYEGFDNKEIAGILKTSPLVVGVVLHRARTRLKKEIGHYLEKHHEKD